MALDPDKVWNGEGVPPWLKFVAESGSEGVDFGAAAVIIMGNLPTSDPAVAGQLWSNAGVLTVSAG